MKALIIFCILVVGIAFAADVVSPFTPLPEAMITAKVIDEHNAPLLGAKVKVIFDKVIPFKTIEALPVTGATNGAGEFTAKGPTAGQKVGGSVEAPGYYRSVFASPLLTSTAGKKWDPWNPKIQVTLKKIGTPIAMRAKKVDTDLPIADEPVGFDLSEGDWIAPYGKGKASDLIFTLTRRFKDARDYESKLSIEFSKPADGIQVWDNDAEAMSALKLPRTAPEAGYVQPLSLSNKRLPGSFVQRDVKEERNYFFRVQTALDEHGTVMSALYGKIDGDIRFSPIRSKTCSLMFTYYLNPTPNDRNVEFDPKRNLLIGSKGEQEVTAP